jgi:hypothetical protein
MQLDTYKRMNSGRVRKPLFHRLSTPIIGDMKTLDELRALPEDLTGCGVYFLWYGDRLNYIGTSVDLGQRLYWHRCAWRYKASTYRVIVPHDRATVLVCMRHEREALESMYLRVYKPPFNKEWQ